VTKPMPGLRARSRRFPRRLFLEALFVSMTVVALAEMGDKTQLATVALAAALLAGKID
jgi:putative Ca2+/H+ antiporter (TMEM165/GDT1 family)